MRQKGTVSLILHRLSFFDTDSTEKLRVHCQTERKEVYLCLYVCVLKCAVPALLLFCDTQSEYGSNEEE